MLQGMRQTIVIVGLGSYKNLVAFANAEGNQQKITTDR